MWRKYLRAVRRPTSPRYFILTCLIVASTRWLAQSESYQGAGKKPQKSLVTNGKHKEQLSMITQEEFERQAETIPPQEVYGDVDCSRDCHLKSSCFDPSVNLWHPTRCPTRRMDEGLFGRCFDGNRTILLVGDSRMRQMEREMAAFAKGQEFFHVMTSVRGGNRYHQHNVLARNGSLSDDALRRADNNARALMELGDFSYSVASTLFTCGRGHYHKLLKTFLSLAGQRGQKHLFLGWNGAWALLVPTKLARDPASLESSVWNCKNSWQNMLFLVKSVFENSQDTEIIFILDTLPVRNSEDGLTEEEHVIILNGLKFFNREMKKVLRKFPLVKVMDSHLFGNRAYVRICDGNKVVRNYQFPESDVKIIFEATKEAWNCGNRWHPGRLHQRMVAELVLNHVCSDVT